VRLRINDNLGAPMQIECKTLYNLLRMNWLRHPAIMVEPWQVDDYRAMQIESIFQRLAAEEIYLDRVSFLALAGETDTPEDCTEALLVDLPMDPSTHDKIYLLIFELWRRFVPEKQCLSIFCDELDQQIDLYDRGKISETGTIQDILDNLVVILDENADQGVNPCEAFASVSKLCAHDLETFLYDFIADQLDRHNYTYAAELLDDFKAYVQEIKWFELLHARLIAATDQAQLGLIIQEIMEWAKEQPDLEFNFELLSILALGGGKDLFLSLVKQSLPLLRTEDDFRDLLAISADFLQGLDYDSKELIVQGIVKKRSGIASERPFDHKSSDVNGLLEALK